MLPEDSIQCGFPEKGKKGTDPVLTTWSMGKESWYVREAHSWTFLPTQPKNNGKIRTRQNQVRRDRALKQVRGIFSWPVGLGLSVVPVVAVVDSCSSGLCWAPLCLCCSFYFLFLRATSQACQHCLSAPTHKNCSSEEQEKEPLLAEVGLASQADLIPAHTLPWARKKKETFPPLASASFCWNHATAMLWVIWN